ncbi:hypothetical protein [Bacillus sp. Marseille-P3661]|uniref:hypothetical protein n=1 Tax=Bacillus sp. Marseille-P3661 TaxID=1936234 RepID=UPI000C8247BD|nr:hypothetical protein [Bacillus sp. Marseille-P3661]
MFLLLAADSEFTRSAPSFHNPGHLRMWYDSPLREFNPHILMIVLGAILLAWLYYYFFFIVKKARESETIQIDNDEKNFQQLLIKRATLVNKMIELEDKFIAGSIVKEEFDTKFNAYKKHLIQVKLDLRKFTD